MVMYGSWQTGQAVGTMTKRTASKQPAKTPARVVKARIAEAAKRALAEAEARRRCAPMGERLPAEQGGQSGPEPTRYGDWEKKGIISDF
jgi:hypothetical protein